MYLIYYEEFLYYANIKFILMKSCIDTSFNICFLINEMPVTKSLPKAKTNED
jgi:hypothetical protein